MFARKLALPYPIVLVLAGLILSFIPRLPAVRLNPDVVFYFFLSPLLYPAALFTSWRDFRRNLRAILLLFIGIEDDGGTDEEERTARLQANRAALDLIEELAKDCGVPDEVADRLRAEYGERMAGLERCAGEGEDRRGEIATPSYRKLQHKALKVERETIIRLRNERRIQRDLDLAEARLSGD